MIEDLKRLCEEGEKLILMIPNETELVFYLQEGSIKNNFITFKLRSCSGFLHAPHATKIQEKDVHGLMFECDKGKITAVDAHDDTIKQLEKTKITQVSIGFNEASGIAIIHLAHNISIDLSLKESPGKPGGALYIDTKLLLKAGNWLI